MKIYSDFIYIFYIMILNIEDSLSDYLKKLIFNYDNNINNNNFENFNTKNKCYMEIKKIDDLYLLVVNKISKNLIHSNESINTIIHNINYCIFDSSVIFLYINYKKNIMYRPYDNQITNEIIDEIKNNWNKINIYENIGISSIFLKHNDTIYFYDVYEQNLISINKINYIRQYYDKLNINLNNTNNKVIEINIILNKYTHLLYYTNSSVIENILINDKKNIYFSCFDEFLFELDNISKNDEKNKKLTINGYTIKYNNTEYIFNTYIYQKIIDLLIPFRNINKTYLELYKNDNLKFVINYMSQYSTEIIKRVNYSIKTISREFLNIYHITRRKLNSDLYNILSNTYKTILFDLHKIFIYTRKNDDIDDIFKKSLTYDIIYKYLKKININLLVQIYIDRIKLLNDIKYIKIDIDNMRFDTNEFKILFIDCIHTKTMSALLQL